MRQDTPADSNARDVRISDEFASAHVPEILVSFA